MNHFGFVWQMWIKRCVVAVLVAWSLAGGICTELAANDKTTKVRIIFDTDMDSDVDDVAALAQLHAMADAGEAEILAVMISAHQEWSAPCVDAINTYFGRPDLPIGLVSQIGRGIKQNSAYAKVLAEEFPQDYARAHEKVEAVHLYRRILASQPDGSVVIVSVGDLTNLAALQGSNPDEYSELSGMELVKQKVREYVCMGSRYPAEVDPGKAKWGNFRTDPESTREVNDRWPTMLTFTGGGAFADSMAIGKRIVKMDPTKSPVSRAYQAYFAVNRNGPVRHTADSIAVWIAVRGFGDWFEVVERGSNTIDEIGRNAWVVEPDLPNRRYTSALKDPSKAEKLAGLMEDLAMHRAP